VEARRGIVNGNERRERDLTAQRRGFLAKLRHQPVVT
jgi:hypothetical protein